MNENFKAAQLVDETRDRVWKEVKPGLEKACIELRDLVKEAGVQGAKCDKAQRVLLPKLFKVKCASPGSVFLSLRPAICNET